MGRASSNPAALEGGNGWRDVPVDIKPGVAELDHAVARQGFRRTPRAVANAQDHDLIPRLGSE